jgi:hypothetical protein
VKRRRPKRRGEPGERYVTKKSIKETEAPFSKDFLASFSRDHYEVLQRFRGGVQVNPPIPSGDLSGDDLNAIIDRLAEELQAIPPGADNATRYHRTVTAILHLVFYPRLTSPSVEQEVDQGRKRIDLMFDNSAQEGFFHRLHSVHNTPSQYIKIECKNYSRDVANPELDQMIGRLHVNTGKFGLIVCRRLEDAALFRERCRDVYQNQQGIIIPLVDADLLTILRALQQNQKMPDETVLQAKLREIQVR